MLNKIISLKPMLQFVYYKQLQTMSQTSKWFNSQFHCASLYIGVTENARGPVHTGYTRRAITSKDQTSILVLVRIMQQQYGIYVQFITVLNVQSFLSVFKWFPQKISAHSVRLFGQPQLTYKSIYKFGLSVCLFVCIQ